MLVRVSVGLEDLFDKLKEHEGGRRNAYTDTKGNVTIGYGSMFNDVEKFKKIPLYYENRLATPEEKEIEFYRLNGKRNQNFWRKNMLQTIEE